MHLNNEKKILSYILPFMKSPIVIDGESLYSPVNKIQIGTSFFNTDSCQVCGECCVADDSIFMQFEYDIIQQMTPEEFRDSGKMYSPEGFDPTNFIKLKNNLIDETHVINGKEIHLYRYPKESINFYRSHRWPEPVIRPSCTWIGTDKSNYGKCTIHTVTSITCKLPHLKVIERTNGTTSLTVGAYGHNNYICCPITFPEPRDEEEFKINKADRLDKLALLNKAAKDLNCTDNYIEYTMDYIDQISYDSYKDHYRVNILKLPHKLFNI